MEILSLFFPISPKSIESLPKDFLTKKKKWSFLDHFSMSMTSNMREDLFYRFYQAFVESDIVRVLRFPSHLHGFGGTVNRLLFLTKGQFDFCL